MPHGAPHDLPQDVAAPFVRRQDAVGDEERHRAKMVGDHAHRYIRVIGDASRRCVRAAGALSDGRQDRGEQVRVVVGELALDHRGDPFEPHAGVDRRRRQWRQGSAFGAVELHEHVVPDLDVPLAAALHAQAHRLRTGDFVAAEVVDLRAAAARTGVTHLPEVLGQAKLGDARRRHELRPAGEGLIVTGNSGFALEHRREQPIGIEVPRGGEQLPGEANRLVLEVVAKREVSEHLEERVMPQRRPDVVEVVVFAADPHALLRRRRPPIVTPFLAEKQVLELIHPRIREQQGGIVGRDERRRGHDLVLVAREVVQKRLTDLIGGHHDMDIVLSGRTLPTGGAGFSRPCKAG